MARTGRPRKHPSQQQGHRPAHQLTVVEPQTVASIVVPEPPLTVKGEQLCDRALRLWDSYWLSPVAQALDAIDGVDRYVVERWVRSVDEAERLESVVHGSRLVQGSQEQPVLNPLYAALRDERAVIRRCEEVLGLTPTDRARLGIAVGEERLTAAKLNEQLDRDAAKRAAQ